MHGPSPTYCLNLSLLERMQDALPQKVLLFSIRQDRCSLAHHSVLQKEMPEQVWWQQML